MATSWQTVQDAFKAGIVAISPTPALAVVWTDEQRPAAKVLVILDFVSSVVIQDRETYTETLPGEFEWGLSTLQYVRIQVRVESVYNAPGRDALFTMEQIRAGLRRPDIDWGPDIVLQHDTQTYYHHVSFKGQDGRTINSYSFETGFRCVLDYPLEDPVDAGIGVVEVVSEGEADVNEDVPVEIDHTITRP